MPIENLFVDSILVPGLGQEVVSHFTKDDAASFSKISEAAKKAVLADKNTKLSWLLFMYTRQIVKSVGKGKTFKLKKNVNLRERSFLPDLLVILVDSEKHMGKIEEQLGSLEEDSFKERLSDGEIGELKNIFDKVADESDYLVAHLNIRPLAKQRAEQIIGGAKAFCGVSILLEAIFLFFLAISLNLVVPVSYALAASVGLALIVKSMEYLVDNYYYAAEDKGLQQSSQGVDAAKEEIISIKKIIKKNIISLFFHHHHKKRRRRKELSKMTGQQIYTLYIASITAKSYTESDILDCFNDCYLTKRYIESQLLQSVCFYS